MSPDRPIKQSGQSSAVRRLTLTFLFAVTLGSITLITFHLTRPQPPNAYTQAADLDALIHHDPRFIGVRAMCAAGKSTIVLAPEDLPNDLRSSLERLVRQHTFNQSTEVRYIRFNPKQ